MGCDIHCFAEAKIDGKWIGLGETTHVERNYQLFSKMAGVRQCEGVTPIAGPRGLPKDASELTKLHKEHWGVDGHSSSWLSAEEVNMVEEWVKDKEYRVSSGHIWRPIFDYVFGSGWDFNSYKVDGKYYDMPDGFEDARVVFWFDN